MDFRTRIKELCQEQGITQKELAEKMGITNISLNKTLRGEYPQLQTLEKIATVLNIPISDLFKKNDSGEDVNGYIKAKGTVYEIHSFDDLEKVLRLKEG